MDEAVKSALPKALQDAAHLQEIEGNPLSNDQIEMFLMFEREGWEPERRRAYMLGKLRTLAAE